MKRAKLKPKIGESFQGLWIVVFGLVIGGPLGDISDLERSAVEGDSPVSFLARVSKPLSSPWVGLFENAALIRVVDSHPKLNMTMRLIAQKYCEGKVKRPLKRAWKALEIVKRKPYITVDWRYLENILEITTCLSLKCHCRWRWLAIGVKKEVLWVLAYQHGFEWA